MVDLRNAVFILCTVIMIDIDLFCWMWLLGIVLDSVAFVQLVMAVGLTVDYIIHTSHAIVHAKPDNITYKRRLEISMLDMGVSVIKGGWTTFLGCLALSGSASASFRSFFVLFVGIILISLLHGLIFVPAVIGEILNIRDKSAGEETKSNTKKWKKIKKKCICEFSFFHN